MVNHIKTHINSCPEACAQTKLKVEPIDVSDDAVEQIARLEKEVDDAKEKQINVLSPTRSPTLVVVVIVDGTDDVMVMVVLMVVMVLVW